MTYLEWLSERFRRGEGFAEGNARQRQARLGANNGQERSLVSLPHYLAALWNGQGVGTTGSSVPQSPSPAKTSNQARSQDSSAKKMARPALGELPKPPAPPPEAYQKLGVNFRCPACRHLTGREKQELMATAYSEDVNGSVAEYEAFMSTILNRANSGDPQFGGGRPPRNVHDVIHARRQFGGVPSPQQEQRYVQQRRRAGKKIPGSPYLQFSSGDIDEGKKKDLNQALQNLLMNDYPTTAATAYIARGKGVAPTTADIKALGSIISGPENIGDAYFYRLSPTVTPVRRKQANTRKR
jgi:hypothetical protein